MNLRVLMIQSEPEELLFLQDVIRELEEQRWLGEWSRIETYSAATWAQAEQILATSSPHTVLLDLDLDEKGGIETFRLAQAAAPDVPLILLIQPNDEALASKLILEGAEDFLVKKEIDCAPLAHALRNAVGRHKRLAALRAAALTDSLTGLLNHAGFFAAASRDRKLAERLRRRWMLLVAEPRNLGEIVRAFGEQRRDLELVEAADHLRAIAGPADLLGRIGAGRFGMGVFDSNVESAEEAWVRIRAATAERRIDIGASFYDHDRPLSLDAMLELAVSDLPPKRVLPAQGQVSIVGAA